MMRILVVSSMVYTSPPRHYGGLELISALRARGFAEMGFEVYLACLRGSRDEFYRRWLYAPEIEFIEASDSEVELARKAMSIARRVDLIVDDSWEGYIAEKFPERSIKIYHAPLPPSSFRLSRYCDKGLIIAGVSKAHAELLKIALHVDVKFVYNGLDPNDYPISYDKDDYALFLSRIEFGKGVDAFLEFCKSSRIRGIMAGEDFNVRDRRYAWEVIHRADKFGVKYLGRISNDEKIELLRRARFLFAWPMYPYFEVFGLYIIEASLCGTPIIGHDNGALPELIRNGVNGYVCKTLDDALRIMDRIDRINPKDCRDWGLKFNYRRMCRDILALIEDGG